MADDHNLCYHRVLFLSRKSLAGERVEGEGVERMWVGGAGTSEFAKRLAMAGGGGFHVFREAGIDGSHGIFGEQRDAFGDGAAKRLGRMKNSDGPSIILDDDFGACADTVQERRDVDSRSLVYRNADHVPGHRAILHPVGMAFRRVGKEASKKPAPPLQTPQRWATQRRLSELRRGHPPKPFIGLFVRATRG